MDEISFYANSPKDARAPGGALDKILRAKNNSEQPGMGRRRLVVEGGLRPFPPYARIVGPKASASNPSTPPTGIVLAKARTHGICAQAVKLQ
jgi:hypothetical protein